MGFRQEVTRSIGKVLKQNGYKMELLSVDCIYFIKRYSDELAFYVRCGDHRFLTDGRVDVKFFFAPIRIPDDCIISMNIGLQVNVLKVNADEYTDEIMIGAGEKIVALEKKLGGLSNMINQEIEHPYFPAGITERYREILLIYNTIMQDINLKEDIIVLKNKAYENIKKKKSSPTYDLCSELIDKLPDGYFKKLGIEMEINEVKNEFSEQLRAQCMFGCS